MYFRYVYWNCMYVNLINFILVAGTCILQAYGVIQMVPTALGFFYYSLDHLLDLFMDWRGYYHCLWSRTISSFDEFFR